VIITNHSNAVSVTHCQLSLSESDYRTLSCTFPVPGLNQCPVPVAIKTKCNKLKRPNKNTVHGHIYDFVL